MHAHLFPGSTLKFSEGEKINIHTTIHSSPRWSVLSVGVREVQWAFITRKTSQTRSLAPKHTGDVHGASISGKRMVIKTQTQECLDTCGGWQRDMWLDDKEKDG